MFCLSQYRRWASRFRSGPCTRFTMHVSFFSFSNSFSNASFFLVVSAAALFFAPAHWQCVLASIVFRLKSVGCGFTFLFFRLLSSTFNLYMKTQIAFLSYFTYQSIVAGNFCFLQTALVIGQRKHIRRIIGERKSEHRIGLAFFIGPQYRIEFFMDPGCAKFRRQLYKRYQRRRVLW